MGLFARPPKLFSIYILEQRGFLALKYWQTGSFKACQTAFRTEFGERRAPSKCCIQKLVKKLETRRSMENIFLLCCRMFLPKKIPSDLFYIPFTSF